MSVFPPTLNCEPHVSKVWNSLFPPPPIGSNDIWLVNLVRPFVKCEGQKNVHTFFPMGAGIRQEKERKRFREYVVLH